MDQFRNGPLTFPLRDSGPAGGEPVVLLHGFPQNGSSWDVLTPYLTRAGYRVLAPEQRGYTPTALARGRRAYRMSELVSDVMALLDAAGIERAHLVGHDWGAAVAWSVAAAAPQRPLSLTALSVPHPAAMRRAALSSSQGLKSWYILLFQLPWLPELLLDPCRPRGHRRLVRSLVNSGQERSAAERDAAALAQPGLFTGALNWYRGVPFGTLAGPVRVPTLFLWGRRDTFIGARAASACARYVEAPYEFRALPGDHWIQDDVYYPLLTHLAAHGAGEDI
ncbi:MAG TPA: alpha/beta fold hydrolase [Frankiaceae bacterium]|nr:alpha/beta fold hydrolase [Frankiaceae bacterium]